MEICIGWYDLMLNVVTCLHAHLLTRLEYPAAQETAVAAAPAQRLIVLVKPASYRIDCYCQVDSRMHYYCFGIWKGYFSN